MSESLLFPSFESNDGTSVPTSSDILDFAKIFEDDVNSAFLAQPPQAVQSSTDDLTPRPIAPQALPQQQQQLQNQQQGNPLVNLMFLVDPNTQQVIFPQQQLEALQKQQQQDSLKNCKTIHTGLINEYCQQNNCSSLLQQQQQQQQLGAGPRIAFAQSNSQSSTATSLPFTLANLPSFALGQQQGQQTGQPQQEQPAVPPLRALSAYNFFFRDERNRILHEQPHDWSIQKQDALLQEHWARDRTKKRRHRKTHGKIDFTTLSKLISTRWKELEPEHKEFYRETAARDWERYQNELQAYKTASTPCIDAAQQKQFFAPVVG